MKGTICVLGQDISLPVIKNNKPSTVAPFIGGTNLCKEILLPNIMFNEPKHKFSRTWYVAEYNWEHYTEVMAWCKEHFGPHPTQPDAWSRWHDKYNGKVLLRDEKDYAWFMLRWS